MACVALPTAAREMLHRYVTSFGPCHYLCRLQYNLMVWYVTLCPTIQPVSANIAMETSFFRL